MLESNPVWGGTQVIFWWGYAARGLKPLSISKDFPSSRKGWFNFFLVEIFANQDPFLKVFLPQKNADFTFFFFFFAILVNSSKDFLTKMGPTSQYFWWKSSPFGWHIPVCLNMWLPPGLYLWQIIFNHVNGLNDWHLGSLNLKYDKTLQKNATKCL